MIDALPFGLCVVDRDLRVVAWNRQREAGPIGEPSEQTRFRVELRAAGAGR